LQESATYSTISPNSISAISSAFLGAFSVRDLCR
jgi:hypothetical protein